jgi:RNA polymerase sigma-70 factor (ECF subfamily)
MYGIARNTRADHFRKHNSQNQHCDIDELEIATEFTLAENFESEEQQGLFTKSLEKLPREHREIIILSRFQQLNYQEIASLLDCNLNTLKARMRKAICVLQDNYQQLIGGSTHGS